jgi:hypothetical protein
VTAAPLPGPDPDGGGSPPADADAAPPRWARHREARRRDGWARVQTSVPDAGLRADLLQAAEAMRRGELAHGDLPDALRLLRRARADAAGAHARAAGARLPAAARALLDDVAVLVAEAADHPEVADRLRRRLELTRDQLAAARAGTTGR